MAVLQSKSKYLRTEKRQEKRSLKRSSPWGSWKYPRSRKISRDWKR